MAAKKGLGRGLSALLSDSEQEYDIDRIIENKFDATPEEANMATEVSLALIEPNADQPRKVFDESSLMELTNSIRLHGVISPLIVVKRPNGKYMLIAGERRWRAAKRAGLLTVPVLVRNYTEQQIKEISLIDNLQREDLNPIDTANAIKELMSAYHYTQEQVSERIGKSRPAVANYLRLLTLTPEVMNLVAKNELSAGHARCLVVVVDPVLQLKLAQDAIKQGMPVRQFEKLIKNLLNAKPEKPKPVQSIELKDMVGRMQRVFATKVSVLGNDNKGRIYIDYYNRDDLDRIADLLNILENK